MDEGARAVHGIDNAFLADKPRFIEIVGDFMEFLGDAEIIAHNASFDLAFLDAELEMAIPGSPPLASRGAVLDTLLLAREKYPGQQNSLNALCKRLEIDNRHREMHGALIDAQLLTDVYLAMTAGQADLGLVMDTELRARPTVHAGPVAGVGLRMPGSPAASRKLPIDAA